MNYREWLLYRAQQYRTEPGEPEVLRYTTWRNHEAVRNWIRRSDAAHAAHLPKASRHEHLADSSPS